jgi:hypothetical protein
MEGWHSYAFIALGNSRYAYKHEILRQLGTATALTVPGGMPLMTCLFESRA